MSKKTTMWQEAAKAAKSDTIGTHYNWNSKKRKLIKILKGQPGYEEAHYALSGITHPRATTVFQKP